MISAIHDGDLGGPEDGRANQGKVARLPAKVRAELNRRLYEGETALTLLPWLNSLQEVKQMLAAEFAGVPITDNNLSRWRRSGYQDWLKRRDRLEHIKDLSKYAADLARAASGTIAEGAMAMASGQILDLFETIEDATQQSMGPEMLIEVSKALQKLRLAEQNDVKLALEKKKVAQKDEELSLDKQRFQRQTLELFLKWRANQRAVEIADSPADNTEKIERLGQLIFGEDFRPK